MVFDTVIKPWGSYTDFVREPNMVIKELTVKPGNKLSLQSHKMREEHWICVSGNGKAIVGNSELPLEIGSHIHVPKKTIHRIINDGEVMLRIAEVQLGECLETDITRYEDDFGRQGTNS